MRLSIPARTRYLVLALAAALIAATFAYLYLGSLSRRVPVVVAARDFPAFTTLDASYLDTVLLPPAAVLPTTLGRVGDAAGKVSLVPRVAGEQILAPSLASGGEPGQYRAGLAPEERALYLPAGSVLGGWLGVKRGDYVDLVVVLEGTGRCLAQGLEVLEVISGEQGGSVLNGRSEPPAGVLLRVTPGAAEEIALAVEYGKVYYSITGYAGVVVPTSGAWLERLYKEEDGSDGFTWP